jgi:hypothetical protein
MKLQCILILWFMNKLLENIFDQSKPKHRAILILIKIVLIALVAWAGFHFGEWIKYMERVK